MAVFWLFFGLPAALLGLEVLGLGLWALFGARMPDTHLEDPSDAERIEEYLHRGGGYCPRCGSIELKLQPGGQDTEDPRWYLRGLLCRRCGCRITEGFYLTTIALKGKDDGPQD